MLKMFSKSCIIYVLFAMHEASTCIISITRENSEYHWQIQRAYIVTYRRSIMHNDLTQICHCACEVRNETAC